MPDATDRPLITYDYSVRDHEIVDYRNFVLPGIERVLLRGPRPSFDRPWFTCIGAAQTQGIYVAEPFPDLVSEAVGIEALNLGIGGAWPGLFVDRCPELLDRAGASRFAVLQAMSARGEGSRRFRPTERIEQQLDTEVGDTVPSVVAWKRSIEGGVDVARAYVAELRANWVASNLALIDRLDCPVVFLWFSRRGVDAEPSYTDEGDAFANMGEFPHYVDRASVDAVRAACAGYAECTSTRNSGHRLVSRFTGEPVEVDQSVLAAQRRDGAARRDGASEFSLSHTHNHYYPSPEMHVDAAGALLEELRRLDLV